MAADRESVYKVTFEGDAGSLPAALVAIKASFRNTAADLQSTADKLTLFNKVLEDAKATGVALDQARLRVTELQRAIEAAKGKGAVGDELVTSLKVAEKQVTTTTKALEAQSVRLAKMSVDLKTAGVDTSKLATEEARLATEIAKATAAAAQQSAKDVLGVKTLGDVEPEIVKLRAAFDTLRASGKLSAAEISAAHVQLESKIKEVRGGVTDLGATAAKTSSSLQGIATAGATAIAPLLAFGAVAKILHDSAEAAHEFHNRLAEIATVTDISDAGLEKLGEGARRISLELGINAQDALKSLFDLLRTGVPQENALEVLRVSATAARAALADTATGAKAADTILSSLNTPVSELAGQLDKVIRASKDGGPTLKEFADSAGPLLGVAKAAGIGFDDLVATLAVLSDSVGNAGEAIGILQKIIVGLNTREARDKLRDLGIEGTSLVGIFTELGKRNLALDSVLQLGIASAKSAAGVSALTNNAAALGPELDKVRNAAGTAAANVQKLFDSPEGRTRRFNAAIQEAETNLGALLGSGSRVQETVRTQFIDPFNAAADQIRRTSEEAHRADSTFGSIIRTFLGFGPAAASAAQGATAAADATKAAADAADRSASQIADATTQLARAKSDLAGFATDLATQSQALQAASARDIADLTARADAQIAALDRSSAATADTAAKTLAIQQKLADDRTTVLLNTEAKINAATEAAVKAREKIARDEGVSEQKIAADSAAARLGALGPVLQGYQQHYAALIQLAQGEAAKVQSLAKDRISFNQDVETKLRDIRNEGLSDFDRFVQVSKDADTAISRARAAAANGDIETAKKYTDQAIELAGSVKTAVDANGVQIVTALQAQQTKIEIIKKAQDAYNDALENAGDSAKQGAAGFEDAAKDVAGKIQDLQGQYDTLKKSVAEGLTLKIDRDEESITAALRAIDDISDRLAALKAPITTPNKVESNVGDIQKQIDDLKKPTESTHTIHVKTDQQGGGDGGDNGVEIPPLFNRGGLVGRRSTASLTPDVMRAVGAMRALATPVRGFARGGRVLKDARVPGAGDRDTVPADLQAGSFVLRKAAVAHYGEGLMRALITGQRPQRFALGGQVGELAKRLLGGSAAGDALAQRILAGGGANPLAAGPRVTGGLGPDPELAHVINQASDLLTPLIADASTLPRARPGLQNLSDWLAAVLALIRSTRDVDAIKQLLDKLTKDAQGYRDAIANSRQWHVPAIMGNAAGGLGVTLPEPNLSGIQATAHRAMGGPTGTDTVPALLTPGEYVMSKAVVQKYGVPLMHALNRKLVPKESLARLLDLGPALRNVGGLISQRMLQPPRPQHFATGGPVDSVAFDARTMSTSSGGGVEPGTGGSGVAAGATLVTNNTVNMNVDIAALYSETNVRRYLLPVLNSFNNRAR